MSRSLETNFHHEHQATLYTNFIYLNMGRVKNIYVRRAAVGTDEK